MEQKEKIIKGQQEAREILIEKQNKQRLQELKKRQARLKKGIRSIWDRLTGKHQHIQKQNEIEAYQANLHNQTKKDSLIFIQLEERTALQNRLQQLNTIRQDDINQLKEALFAKLPEEKITRLRQEFNHFQSKHGYNHGRDLSL